MDTIRPLNDVQQMTLNRLTAKGEDLLFTDEDMKEMEELNLIDKVYSYFESIRLRMEKLGKARSYEWEHVQAQKAALRDFAQLNARADRIPSCMM